MKVTKRKGMVVIRLPLIDPPRESKSGKTLLVASSNGPKRTAVKFHGKPMIAIVTVYIRPDGHVKTRRIQRRKKISRQKTLAPPVRPAPPRKLRGR